MVPGPAAIAPGGRDRWGIPDFPALPWAEHEARPVTSFRDLGGQSRQRGAHSTAPCAPVPPSRTGRGRPGVAAEGHSALSPSIMSGTALPAAAGDATSSSITDSAAATAGVAVGADNAAISDSVRAPAPRRRWLW